jgi:TetR/AcrR family transcriptional regulator
MITPDASTPSSSQLPEHEVHARKRLLKAAIQIFDRKGYAATSVREVAEMAGVTKPVVYYHFGSKEGLLVAILDQAVRVFTQTLDAAVARAGSARERLQWLCEDIYALFEEHVSVARVAHMMFLGPRETCPPYDLMVLERRLREAVVRIVSDGQLATELRRAEPEDVALAVIGILEGCQDRQMFPELSQVGRNGLRRILSLLFDGLVIDRPKE